VNRFKAEMVRRGYAGHGGYPRCPGDRAIGVVPEDDTVLVASKGSPAALDERSKAGKAFRNIARRLGGEDVPFEVYEARDGFFGRLSRLVRPGEG
jgi:septum site-determining protein MinD